MRHMFAYVTQETVLFHDSILNNVKIAKLNATNQEVYEACQQASIHDFIMSLPQGYNTKVAELGASLSGGERQRIGPVSYTHLDVYKRQGSTLFHLFNKI